MRQALIAAGGFYVGWFVVSTLISITADGAVAPESLPLDAAHLPAREAFPECLWEKLSSMCRARFHTPKGLAVRAEWGALPDGRRVCRCMTYNSPSNTSAYVGRFKHDNPEFEVQLMRGCVADEWLEPPPPIGEASLPRDALERSLFLPPGLERGGATDPLGMGGIPWRESAALASVRSRLQGNGSVSIVALGASVTSMFADLCDSEHECVTGPHESDAAFDGRIRKMRQARGKAKHAEDSDWLYQLLRTLKHGYPHASIAARSVAYGGMSPKSVTSCVADFVAPPVEGAPLPDLAILDFALFGGMTPEPTKVGDIEALVRSLWPFDIAVLLLNVPSWCLGPEGTPHASTHGHQQCQRMLFNRSQSRAHIGAMPLPGAYDARLSRVASHYSATAISLSNALQPLLAAGHVDAIDFTLDGMHPIVYPRKTEELAYDSAAEAWRALPGKAKKPGITSVARGDVVDLVVDTSIGTAPDPASLAASRRWDNSSLQAPPTSSASSGLPFSGAPPVGPERPMLQLTYLQSYEQVGILRLQCVSGCACETQRIQTLEPSRLATLNTSLWPASASRACTLRLTNDSPADACGGEGGAAARPKQWPCTKIKLVALAVTAVPATAALDSRALRAAATKQVEQSVGLSFLR